MAPEDTETPPVPAVSEEGVFMAGGEGRIAESEYVQQRGARTEASVSAPESTDPAERERADTEVRTLVAEYLEHVPALLEHLKDLGEQMNDRRTEIEALIRMYRRLPESEEHAEQKKDLEDQILHTYDIYDNTLRRMMTESHAKSGAMNVRLGAIAEGVELEATSPEARAEAAAAKDRMDDTFATIEKTFGELIVAHDGWTEAHKNEFFGKRRGDEQGNGSDYGPMKPRVLEAEFYGQRMMALMEKVAELETAVEGMSSPSSERVAMLLMKLDGVETKMFRYDDETNSVVKTASRERRDLEGMIRNLRGKLFASVNIPESEEELPELELIPEPEETYEVQAVQMAREVGTWERIINKLEERGDLSDPAVRNEMLEELRKYPAKLLEMDQVLTEAKGDPEQSETRRALVAQLTKLRERLTKSPEDTQPLPDEFYINQMQPGEDELHINEQQPERTPSQVEVKPIPGDPHGFIAEEKPDTRAASTVHDLRAMRDRVRASYASVQHRLSWEQRRDIRGQLHRLAKLVRRTELEHVIARATEHAPALAHATLTSLPRAPRRYEVRSLPVMPAVSAASAPSRGIWGSLGNAFKLK